MSSWPPEFIADGKNVRLEISREEHAVDLAAAVAKGELHKLWYTMIPEPDGISDEIQRRLALREQGNMLPFTIIDKSSEKPVGMTTYMNIDAITPRLEIGSTWICPSVQKTPINTECKYLLLQHAFKELHCIAVEFRTHFVNNQSRRAIERLGAKFDGVIRSHMIMQNGTVRDTAIYSILRSEWPTVQANLRWQLEKPRI